MPGTRIGKLLILSTQYVVKPTYKKLFALCLCDCGTEALLQVNSLGGNTESCGCGQASFHVTHGMTGKPVHKAWIAMKSRCTTESITIKPHYKDRGITVCDRWQSFENFYEDMGDKPAGMTLERIDNDKGYFKENCKWATKAEQERNKTTSVFVIHSGLGKMVFTDACALEGIHVQCATSRLRSGKSLQEALASSKYSWFNKELARSISQ